MITANQIKVFSTASQGLLAVYVDRGQGQKVCHRWKVSNEGGGVWCAYAMLSDGVMLYCDKDLSRHIHRDSLTAELADIMNVYSDELASDDVVRGGQS